MGQETLNTTHPALEGKSRLGMQTRHVLGNTMKYGLMGGLGGAMALGGIVALNPVGLGAILASSVTGIGGGVVSAVVSSAAITGATYGAAIGAAGGGVLGVSGAEKAADAEEDKLINRYEQALARQQRMERLRDARDRQMMAMERQAEYMGQAQNPNVGLPRNNTQGRDGMAYP